MNENTNILSSEYFWNSPFFKVTKFAILFFVGYLLFILLSINLTITYLLVFIFSLFLRYILKNTLFHLS